MMSSYNKEFKYINELAKMSEKRLFLPRKIKKRGFFRKLFLVKNIFFKRF
jgi:hypothetical protein